MLLTVNFSLVLGTTFDLKNVPSDGLAITVKVRPTMTFAKIFSAALVSSFSPLQAQFDQRAISFRTRRKSLRRNLVRAQTATRAFSFF
jgi:hypothetical protein